jgi:surface antigen
MLLVAGGIIRQSIKTVLRKPNFKKGHIKLNKDLLGNRLRNKMAYFAWKSKRLKRRLPSILNKPTRQIAHFTVILTVLAVFALSTFSTNNMGSSAYLVDPFDFKKSQIIVSEAENLFIASTVLETYGGLEILENNNLVKEKDLIQLLPFSANNFLSKPILAATDIPEGRQRTEIINYLVESGDTVSNIAVQFGITTDTIIWANNITSENLIKPGQTLVILPVSGVLHTVKSGDTVLAIANRYKASEEEIISFNDLEDNSLVTGQKLVIPNGKMPEPPRPAATRPDQVAPRTRIAPSYKGPNRFPYGWCTWWVASKRYIPWNGNAWQWYGNAQAMGYATGSTPAPGAIMVTWENRYYGHVAYVESVSGNTFTVSEMNYRGWGIASTRTVTLGSVPLIGFIY